MAPESFGPQCGKRLLECKTFYFFLIIPLLSIMKKSIITIGISVMFLGTIAQTAVAVEATPTMNQPDNGFYEGPNPEWAVLHSTNIDGTAAHRQYHRDAVKALFLWLEQHRSEKGTAAYDQTYRNLLQERNMDHRHFHTASPASPSGLPYENPVLNGQINDYYYPNRTTSESRTSLSTGNITRRSIIAAAEQQDRLRVLAKAQ
jgi:hypothetical protein